MVRHGNVATAAAQAKAAATALQVGRRTAAVDKKHHLLARFQALVHCGLQRAAEDITVAFTKLGAHVHDVDRRHRPIAPALAHPQCAASEENQ